MNPNAPEHQPEVMRDIAVIQVASTKMFTAVDNDTAEKLNEWVEKRDEMVKQRMKFLDPQRKHDLPEPPNDPLFAETPSASESNLSPHLNLSLFDGVRSLNDKNGTSFDATDIYLQYICDFANQWHSKLSGVDCRSPGTDPMFYSLQANFYDRLMSGSHEAFARDFTKLTTLTRKQFWKLRYLFIPISFRCNQQPNFHVALCAISPEAGTVDYLCSGGDSGLKHSRRSDGSKCVAEIFVWLAEFLKDDPKDGFLPYNWKLRTDYGHEQHQKHKDCGIYTVTHAMALAFGWGIGKNSGAFPQDHRRQAKRVARRQRYVADLMHQGFKFYDPDSSNNNIQYYPLLDTIPISSKDEHFTMLPKEVVDALPSWAVNRRACYVDCPSKMKLRQHCKRNARFYPGWDRPEISGLGVDLKGFKAWVEDMDSRRKRKTQGGCKALPYPQFQPQKWIDPRDKDPKAIPSKPLWKRLD